MKKGLIFAISIVVGGACGFLGAMYIDKVGGRIMDLFFLLFAFLVAAYLQIIVHEGGHLIFGLLTGYRFVSFRVGGIILYKQQGKLKLGKYSLAGTGGQCLLAPPDLDEEGKMPYVLYNLGGVLLNGICSLVCLLVLLNVKPGSVISCFCIGMIGVGLLFMVMNGLPMRLGEVDNDGRNALNMGKCPLALKSLWLQLKVNECQTEGLRLRDMPAEWFQMPSEDDMENAMVATIGVFCCNRMMDEHRFEEAEAIIQQLLEMNTGMVGIYKFLLTLDLVYCELLGERRPEILSRLQESQMVQIMKAMKNYPSVMRTQYAYALLSSNDEKEAKKIKQAFMIMKKNYPYSQEVEGELELMNLGDTMIEM